MTRELKLSDLVELEKDSRFPMPNVNDSLNFIQLAIEEDGILIGAVFGRVTTETSLIFSKNASKIQRTKAMAEIFDAVETIHAVNGFNETHIFLLEDDGSFEKLLTRLGFVPAKGKAMVYYLGTRKDRKLWRKVRNSKRQISQINNPKAPPNRLKKESTVEARSDQEA